MTDAAAVFWRDRTLSKLQMRLPQPYPAHAAVGVASLPRSALVEADGVLVLQD